MLIKVASVLFIFLTLILSGIIVHLFKLQKRGWRSTDIAFPLFALEYYLISDSAFYHSLLPLLALSLSLLALGLTVYFLKKKKSFYYPKFIKYFWRAGFLVTFLLYLILTASLFI
ncbi:MULTISPECIES: DUF3397 family protein [Streptococcus]|jgi:hypothetical protein|uniref:DUF3397 family protein n=2 Tax=Streptococcus TaxID=1301 RepID=A0A9X0WQU5_9STRE|nr:MULTISPECIES: DUF3397 family protein [Streptococcus]MBN2942262.1 DUF3397 family protein [Streptococcus sp.]MBZ1355338.1 DUF3397 domain-containing protein [Streptococcus sp. LPB0406]MBK4779556.1 hypothetical protein [Streptococcus lactarius]MBS6987535.1 DUF3397 family protein [Streptococcus parasanguinis]MBS7068772.1 DUF3397 family protein [Streptococcus parasanguinis]